MKVEVTNKHIAQGLKESCVFCPIALAVHDALKAYNIRYPKLTLWNVMIGTQRVHISNKKFKLSRSAQRFVKRFDKGKDVKPFNFILEVENVFTDRY